ncbi:MAG: phage portal protein [Pseudomonadota bacterium]
MMTKQQVASKWLARWFTRNQHAGEKKSHPVGGGELSTKSAFASLYAMGQVQNTPTHFAAMASEGYGRNPIVYRCVRMISEAAASVPWVGYQGAQEASAHEGMTLVERPNGQETRQEFLEKLITSLLLSGNAFVEHVEPVSGRHRFFVLRSDRVTIDTDMAGWPTSVCVSHEGKKRTLMLGDVGSIGEALHLKLIDPLSDIHGQSPLQAAVAALDVHNSAALWNKSLLDNAARPSGALIYAPADNSSLTPEQFEVLKGELDASFSGSKNAGRPLLLEGGLDWKAMGMTPSDMDFVETKNTASREIALAFGVPPMLLGIPGDNTYANYQEAQRAFYRLTVLPLLRRVVASFTQWLEPVNGAGFRYDIDTNQIEGLAYERDSLWKRLEEASFLTRAEKREAVGYSPLPEEGV